MRIICIILLLLVGCTTLPVTPPSTGPSIWQYDAETKYALENYGQALLAYGPSDLKDWCPSTTDKTRMYTAFLAHLSTRESGRDPNQTYKENFKDSKGNYIISTGLTQVSVESCRSYGSTASSTEDLKSVAKNLECAVRILNRWIPKDGYIAKDKLGCGRYWSVCRPGSSKEYIKSKMQEFCR
jgi:hypothetical protein